MAPGIMCFGRKPVGPEVKRNEEIEKTIRADRKRQEREVKLLLLGAGTLSRPHIKDFRSHKARG